jgi:hypothetical protein
MNTTTMNNTRLLSLAFAALVTLGTFMSVDHLAGAAEVAPQWAQANSVTVAAKV